MDKVFYMGDIDSDYPISSEVYGQNQIFRDALDKVEAERDFLLTLLHEVSEAESTEDLEDVLTRVREITENRPNPFTY